MNEIKISFTLTPRELLWGQYNYVYNKLLIKAAVFVIVFLFVFIGTAYRTTQNPYDFINLNSPGTIILPLTIVFLFLMPYISVKRLVKAKDKIFEPCVLQLTESTLYLQGQTYTQQYEINSIHSVRELGSVFVIYVNKYSILVVPKRCIDVQELSTVRSCLQMVNSNKTFWEIPVVKFILRTLIYITIFFIIVVIYSIFRV